MSIWFDIIDEERDAMDRRERNLAEWLDLELKNAGIINDWAEVLRSGTWVRRLEELRARRSGRTL